MSQIVLLFDRSGYLVRTPSPYTMETALEHLSQLRPQELAERIEIRVFAEVRRESYSLRPEAQNNTPTIPAPPCESAEGREVEQ